MIIQNGQNRNLAICNARQVAMLRGGQWIIEPAVLSSEVKSQIYEDIVTTGHHSASLALEVWRAANLYCKSHAATHPELTAQGKLLSAFVNADVNMYCSLPLALTPEAQSALPTRWLVGKGTGYFNTGLVPTQYPLILGGKFINAVASGEKDFFGNYGGGSTSVIFVAGMNGTGAYTYYGSAYTIGSIPANTKKTIEYEFTAAKGRKITIDGTIYTSTANNGMNSNYPISIFSGGGTRDYCCPANGSKCAVPYIICNGTRHDYLPSKISNLMELLDLETLTIATRVGTFTEQKDIPIS